MPIAECNVYNNSTRTTKFRMRGTKDFELDHHLVAQTARRRMSKALSWCIAPFLQWTPWPSNAGSATSLAVMLAMSWVSCTTIILKAITFHVTIEKSTLKDWCWLLTPTLSQPARNWWMNRSVNKCCRWCCLCSPRSPTRKGRRPRWNTRG